MTVGVAVATWLSGCGQGRDEAGAVHAGGVAPAALSVEPAMGTRLAVLVPDGLDVADPRVTAWLDAASEVGIRLELLTDSGFLALGAGTPPVFSAPLKYGALILPDQVHARAGDGLIAALRSYAAAGGWLMLVYDFGTLDENGFFPLEGPSRLSSLAGTGYVWYSDLRDATIGLGPVAGTSSVLRSLQVPPGKSMASTGTLLARAATLGRFLASSTADPGGLRGLDHAAQFVGPSGSSTATAQARRSLIVAPAPATATPLATATEPLEAISGYVYGPLTYPTFVTEPASSYQGTVLLTSDYAVGSGSGVALGRRAEGSGGVLFVNLPLAYLKGETDTMLMNGLLRYLSVSILSQPRLSEQPGARGGLVFNWHVDAAEAIDPIRTLDKLGVWNRGPYSIHLTAGPDTEHVGDNLGLNVPASTTVQGFISYFLKKGHVVGSHGGWDHDLFGLHVLEYPAGYDCVTNIADMSYVDVATTVRWCDFLAWNKEAIEKVGRKTVTEYSAPEGNNPQWAMDWLETQGHVGYYFTGHTGAAPTRSYRPPPACTSPLGCDGNLVHSAEPGAMLNPGMWAFPVSPFGLYATFEEFQEFGVDRSAVSAWYASLIDFVVAQRTTRLIYAHPPGAAGWGTVLTTMLRKAKSLSDDGRFRWYSMSELADFATRRLDVQWAEGTPDSTGTRTFEATHPSSLSGFAWVLPRSAYAQPAVLRGSATVSSTASEWVVTAGTGTSLAFRSRRY